MSGPRRFVINTKEKINDKYHRILEAAVKVFAEQGFFQSTVSQIAKEAGVADGTIYLYFKNKEDILVQFFSYKARQVFARFRDEVDSAGTAVEKLRNLVRRHLQEFQNDRNMAMVYRAETHQNSRLVEEQIKEMSKMYLDIVSEIVEQGQEEGVIRRDLYLGLVKRFILGAVDEVINTWLHAGSSYDLVTMADPLVDLFMRGIGQNDDRDD
ncbi:MAG: TetR/AcrR family transcriptional regulator [Deltaproteobacteria bacterium]|jgi:TetR/AcrR family fatty acid metabolism transcriptional regulator|nr:TetR/AcrR family transcriptional regulator [Deltaproteobacteria bacterium]MBW2450207.1 TetR/AcrR family transcriptional regulator [Deltaproteobacteria bacterium]MBW2491538.1 TetR/AcrR family transcriptional regulator [Deltaproteobacteria bacterium]